MKHWIAIGILLLTAGSASAIPTVSWPGAGGGGGDLSTLTDTGNLCAADNAVVRAADDLSFTCTALAAVGADLILIEGGGVVDVAGVNFLGGTNGIDIGYNFVGPTPDTATFNLDWTEVVDAVDFVNLEDTLDTDATTTFNIANGTGIIFNLAATSLGVDINSSAATNTDLLHVHQHTGNPTGGSLLTLEAEDVDINPLVDIEVQSPAASAGTDIVGLHITTNDDDDADYVPLLIEDDSAVTPDTLLSVDYTGLLTVPQAFVSGAGARLDISGATPLLAINDTDGALNVASSGVVRLEQDQQVCWRNAAAGGDVCIGLDTLDALDLDGANGLQLPEVTAEPTVATGTVVVLTDDVAAGDCNFAGAGTALSICRYNGATWDPLGDGGGGGAGDVESVGDCATGDCFEGVGAETTLSTATNFAIDVDADNNGTNNFFVTGTAGNLFSVDEGGGGTAVTTYGDFVLQDGWPAFFFIDNQFPTSGNVLVTSTCPTDNDCSWQWTNESGSADTRVSMLSLMTTDAGVSTLYLGGAGAESAGGALATAPDAIGVDETGNATFNTTGGDPADAGKIRLNNTDQVCWEADPTGTEFCLAGDSSEVINASGGMIDVDDVGSPASGTFAVSGANLCWDLDANGCDAGDYWLTTNAPTNTAGDEIVQGSLTVTGDFTVTNVDEPLEDTLYTFRTSVGTTGVASGGAIPGPDDCYPMFGYYTNPIAAAAADPSGSCEHALTDDLHLTEMCVTFVTGTAPTGNCILGLYEKGERGTIHASFDVGAAGAELDSVGDTKCVAIGVDVDDGVAESLYFQADTDAADCDASANWPELEVTLRGYRINYTP